MFLNILKISLSVENDNLNDVGIFQIFYNHFILNNN